MSLQFKYRGKLLSGDDVAFINRLIGENPSDSRWALSKKLCRAWNWVQPNGALKDMVCRGLMLELHRAGHIRLPAKKRRVNNPFVNRTKPAKVTIDHSPVEGNCLTSNPCDFVRFAVQGWKSFITASSSTTTIWAIVIRSENSLNISSILSKDRLPVWPGLQPHVISVAATALSAGRHTAEKRIYICWRTIPGF
jgi:hypothetical protein